MIGMTKTTSRYRRAHLNRAPIYGLALVGVLVSGGCGDNTNNRTEADADASSGDASGGCVERAIPMNLGTIDNLTFKAIADNQGMAGGPILLRLVATLDPGMPPQPKADIFDIRFFEKKTIFDPTFSTGTFDLSGDDTDFYACGACVHILGDATAAETAQDYVASSGTLELTMISRAIGQRVEGSLTDVTLRQVNLGGSTQTNISDGCTANLTSLTFSSLITSN